MLFFWVNTQTLSCMSFGGIRLHVLLYSRRWTVCEVLALLSMALFYRGVREGISETHGCFRACASGQNAAHKAHGKSSRTFSEAKSENIDRIASAFSSPDTFCGIILKYAAISSSPGPIPLDAFRVCCPKLRTFNRTFPAVAR